jgi:hypothetical protein
MCFGKVIGPLGFSHRGNFIGEGAMSGVGRGTVIHRGRGHGPGRAALLCGALVASLHLLFGSLEASVNFWTFGFCLIQFREYFLCNFSETQKQQKTGNWHCGDLLIGYFRKMHKSATKCNETLSKWCKNKHGASKIMDTLETYHSPILSPSSRTFVELTLVRYCLLFLSASSSCFYFIGCATSAPDGSSP